MASKYVRDDAQCIIAPVLTAEVTEVGDLTWTSSGNMRSASDFVWDTNLATTQAAFQLLFVGVAAQRKVLDIATVPGNSTANRIRIDTAGVFEFDCASATFAIGDLVGPAKQTGDLLENQKVVAVATESLACGRVVEAGASVTKVKVRILSQKMPLARQS